MPKKQSTFFFITTIFFIFLSGLFISCKTDVLNDAQLSFSVPQKMFRMATDFLEDEGEEEEDYEITFSVKLVDDSLKEIDSHEEKKKLSEWEAALDSDEDSYTVTFDKVAVGTELYAMVSLYASVDGKTIEFFNGNSEKIKVEEGSNTLSVKLKNVLPKVKLTFLFQESLGGSTYAENEKFPAITLDFLDQTDIEHMAAITKTIMAAYMAGYQVNEEKMPDSPELQKDGTYSLTLYFDLIGKTISGTGSISYNLEYSPFTVSIDKTRISVNGDTITISVKDKDGKLVTSGLDYGVALSYKGTELDNSEYLKFSEPVLTIEPLDIAGRYSLNIVVVQMKDGIVPIVGSQTFDISAVVNTELYVSADGDDSNTGLSATSALASLKKAGEIITESSMKTDLADKPNWTINLKGDFTTPQELSVIEAGSILIKGSSEPEAGVPVDIIDVSESANENNPASALTLQSKSTVTLENVKITGGHSNNNGGGVKCTAGDLVIGEKVIISDNYAQDYGGGVYVSGSLYMYSGIICDNEAAQGGGIYANTYVYLYGDAVVGNKDAKEQADAEHNSNKATDGGGIKSPNVVYLGYSGKTENEELIKADYTGGVYYNYSSGDGGGIRCTVNMNGGSISYNKAVGNGSGVFLTRFGHIYMGGSALLFENDIYLSRESSGYSNPAYYEAQITITSELTTEGVVATITPEMYNFNFQVLVLETEDYSDLSEVCEKFAVTPYNEQTWKVQSTGMLDTE